MDIVDYPKLEDILKRFDEATFFRALANPYCSEQFARKHRVARSIFDSLTAHNARTVLIEPHYIDRDYLADFASYYAECFQTYDRYCKRIHVWNIPFSVAEFRQLLRGELKPVRNRAIMDAYLGFIVVRPLPEAIIGRTVIRPPHNGNATFPVTLEYTPNLFGTYLPITSLAFAEQDNVVAACASTALWSAFHMASDHFQTTTPTLGAITRAATHTLQRGRSFPSRGLTVEQICAAIRSVGLEPDLIELKSGVASRSVGEVPLLTLLYSYLRKGFPVLLDVEIPGQGEHLLTLTGYTLSGNRVFETELEDVRNDKQRIPTRALRIERLWAHDDQLGPFIPLDVQRRDGGFCLVGPNGGGRPAEMVPRYAIAPVDGMIRLALFVFQGWLVRIQDLLIQSKLAQARIPASLQKSHITRELVASGDRAAFFEAERREHARLAEIADIVHQEIEWDVYLASVNDYKDDLKTNLKGSNRRVERLLKAPHPRYMWCATLYLRGKKQVDVLADATGMERACPIHKLFWHQKSKKAELHALLTDTGVQQWFQMNYPAMFYRKLLESTT